MHTRLRIAAVGLAVLGIGALAPIVTAGPAAADGETCITRCAGVEATDSALLATVQSQVNRANQYVSHPTTCVDPTRPEITGATLRWRLTATPQESWALPTGVMYRLECWAPVMGEYGQLLELEVFDALTAENLARLAMDRFLMGLPAPEPRLNPAGTTLVNLDTWLSVDNIPAGELTSPPVTVPGITVIVTARASGVEWHMGDGSAPFTCSGTGSPDSRTCWHYYRRSSSGQPGGEFHGMARVVWTGTYTINGVGGGVEIPVPREAGFSIQVAEGQAVVVR